MFLLLLTGCMYGPSFDARELGSAVLHEDGHRCVFAMNEVFYRPASGINAFPDGGIPWYTTDRKLVGVVDVDDGSVHLLVDQRNRDFLPGQGGFHVQAVRGSHALLHQGGQGHDYQPLHRWFQLHLKSGALTELSLDDDLRAHHVELRRPELVDADFQLVLVAEDPAGAQQIWTRDPDGTLRHLADTEHYYGTHQGEIWWYDTDQRAGARTDLHTGETARERRADFAIPRTDPTEDCHAERTRLVHRTKTGDRWESTELLVPDDIR